MSSSDHDITAERSSKLLVNEDSAILCESVSKSFYAMDHSDVWRVAIGELPIGEAFISLDNISLRVPRGEFLGVLGRNGAGKSTLLRTVGGIHQPSSGVVVLGDQSTGIYELGIGGHELMTGREFAIRWLELTGQPIGLTRECVAEIAEFTELSDYFDRPIRTYSTGMRARLFFATTTAIPAKVYLIDEVLSVGDEYFTGKCWHRLRRWISAGASGILVTHDWSAVLRICTTAAIIDHGRIVKSGSPTAIVRAYLDDRPPVDRGARFIRPLPPTISGVSGTTLVFTLPIQVDLPGKIAVGVSIEQFSVGYGWRHLLHRDPTYARDAHGRIDVAICVPDLPLVAGEYVIGLFLAREVSGELMPSDTCSWLLGNGLKLLVSGSPDSAATALKMSWSIEGPV